MFGRAIMAVTVLALTLGIAPATAIATPQDIASTHAYIRANYAFARATEAEVGPVQANIEALNQRLGRECPRAGSGSPEDDESQLLSYEVVVALWSSSYGTDAGPIGTFVDAVEHLRWSNPRLTHSVHTYALSLHELATLEMPNICGDVSAWKGSNFKTIPATIPRLDQRVEAIEAKPIPSRLLAPYVQPADKSVLSRTARLESKLLQTETVVGFNDWDQLLETLGLNQ